METMTKRTIVMAMLCVLTLGELAHGAVLVTPNNEPDFTTNNVLICYLTNVSKKDLRARIEILSPQGTVVIESAEFTAAPFQRQTLVAAGNASPSLCRFTVKGSKKSVRASACVFQNGVGCTASVAAE